MTHAVRAYQNSLEETNPTETQPKHQAKTLIPITGPMLRSE
jgi:hypothetical protein